MVVVVFLEDCLKGIKEGDVERGGGLKQAF